MHQRRIVESDADATIRTLIFSGRPMRVLRSDYIQDWEQNRRDERDALLAVGKRPYKTDLAMNKERGTPLSFVDTYPSIYGQACGGITDVVPAGDIVRDMMQGAAAALRGNAALLVSKL